MFDMQKIGKKISSLRKEHNMTQLELADKLNISYQAVSNWERGNSMPDISKLPELAEIFNVSLDELLGGKSTLVEAVVKDNVAECIEANNISGEDVGNVLPLLKPQQVSSLVKLSNLTKISDLAKNINSYLPFLDEDTVKEFAEEAAEKGESINAYLPFMDEEAVNEFARKAVEKGEGISGYLPFMEEDDVRNLAEKAREKGESVNMYLPFMDEEAVNEFARKAVERGEGVSAYLPFMEEEDVRELAVKAIERGEGVEIYLPFMNEDDVKELVTLIFKNSRNRQA